MGTGSAEAYSVAQEGYIGSTPIAPTQPREGWGRCLGMGICLGQSSCQNKHCYTLLGFSKKYWEMMLWFPLKLK